jgi:hypothetical protein
MSGMLRIHVCGGTDHVLTAINGLSKAYNMAPDLSLFLSVVAVTVFGDPIKSTWSIGGAFSPTLRIYNATGILGTHNQYEGDASFVRV